MKNRFKKNEKKLINNFFYKEYQKQILSIFIIILLYSIQLSAAVNHKNLYQFLINLNQIKLTIKGKGTTSILYSNFNNNPNKIE